MLIFLKGQKEPRLGQVNIEQGQLTRRWHFTLHHCITRGASIDKRADKVDKGLKQRQIEDYVNGATGYGEFLILLNFDTLLHL